VIYILRVPHRMPPVAYVAADHDTARWELSQRYDTEFDTLDEAVSHDMHAAFFGESIDELRRAMATLSHQRLFADRAVEILADLDGKVAV
jgi:hypothetical protein